jgi:hypothetical protein
LRDFFCEPPHVVVHTAAVGDQRTSAYVDHSCHPSPRSTCFRATFRSNGRGISQLDLPRWLVLSF